MGPLECRRARQVVARLYGPAMSPWPPAGVSNAHNRGSVPPGRPPLRRGTRPAVVVLLGLVVTLAVPQAAPAAVDDSAAEDTRAAARIVLNGLQAVVGPEAVDTGPEDEQAIRLPSTFTTRVLIENPTDQPLDDLSLVVGVYEPATSRSQLREALDTPSIPSLGELEHLALNQPLGTIPAHGFLQTEVTIDAEEAGLVDPANDVTIHPVALSVAQGLIRLDEVRTAAVGLSRPVAHRLETSLVAPLDGPAPPSTGLSAADAAPLLPGGRLDRLLRGVEAAPPETITVAPAPHAVEDLVRLADEAVPGATDMLDRLRAAVGDRADGIVSTPYGLADVPALASAAATEDLASAAIVAGRQRLLDLVGQSPDAAHLLVSPPTPGALDLAPTDVLVALWDDTAGPDLAANPTADVPPARRTSTSSSGRSLDVLMADPWVTDQLAAADGRHGWDVDAHRAVVESAMTFAQAPGLEGRAFAVVPPIGWAAPGRLAEELYTRLADAPWLRPADPVTVAARARVRTSWAPTEQVTPGRTPLLARVGSLDQRLQGLTAAVTDVEQRPAIVSRGNDLLRAMTVWPHPEPLERARGVLDGFNTAIDEAIGEVVVPDDSLVTLASERGVIPVTVQHPQGVPMDVLVEVASQGRLTFQDGRSRPVRLEAGGTTTVSFEAAALSRGTFPLEVTVRTPSGDVVLAREVMRVRASAVSQPALLVVGGVVVLLLIVGRIRRPRRPQLEVVE